MKAQLLNKYVDTTDEARQAFLDVQSEVFVKLHQAIDGLAKSGLKVSDAQEIFEYGLRAGQFMTVTEIMSGLNTDAKEDGEVATVAQAPIQAPVQVKEDIKTLNVTATCEKA